MLQEVDAAVTYEPWLTQGKTTEHGHLLTDSSEKPGLIVGCLVMPAAVFNARKADFRALARAWARAVDYVERIPTRPTRSWRATSAAGSKIRRCLPRPEGRPAL